MWYDQGHHEHRKNNIEPIRNDNSLERAFVLCKIHLERIVDDLIKISLRASLKIESIQIAINLEQSSFLTHGCALSFRDSFEAFKELIPTRVEKNGDSIHKLLFF